MNWEKLMTLFNLCAAIIVDDNWLIYPGSTEDEDTFTLELDPSDDNYINIHKRDNDSELSMNIDGSAVIVKDSEGTEYEIKFLQLITYPYNLVK